MHPSDQHAGDWCPWCFRGCATRCDEAWLRHRPVNHNGHARLGGSGGRRVREERGSPVQLPEGFSRRLGVEDGTKTGRELLFSRGFMHRTAGCSSASMTNPRAVGRKGGRRGCNKLRPEGPVGAAQHCYTACSAKRAAARQAEREHACHGRAIGHGLQGTRLRHRRTGATRCALLFREAFAGCMAQRSRMRAVI